MKVVGTIIGALALFLVLFLFGYSWRDIKSRELPSSNALARLIGMDSNTGAGSPAYVFKDSYDHILANFYHKVDPKELKFAGMSGLMSALGDPHTVFMEPVMAKDFAEDTKGAFGGIGARLGPDPMGAKVPSVFEDGPAKRAGLKQNDLITHVDGKPINGMPVDEVVQIVRGEIGTVVTLTVVRTGTEKPLTIRITRGQVIAPTVEGQVLPGTEIGYMSISMFSEPTSAQFNTVLSKLERSNIKGLVVDVRDNPGGLLESVRAILSNFISSKPVVTVRMRGGGEELVRSFSGQAHTIRYPIVVLINEDSASAAEIFAGVLRDYRLGTLVGEHTYGKASVQNVFPLADGSSAKVTIAKYILPGKAEIARKLDEDGQYISGGLQPDYEVPLDLKLNPTYGNLKTDSQLQKAVDVIQKRLGGVSVFRNSAEVLEPTTRVA
ncbi:MAG: S41 family peptidase [Fimbriimonadaceae bacterium]|nr:S41 family peptidase [Fimbriimonadaceae bacterium]